MSSTALSHLPSASQAPLFFRLDTRSQRLVALTDVMQTPLYWLDEPRSAWPAQLPEALRQPIEQRLASGQGGRILVRFADLQWNISLSHEQDAFWLICLQTQRQDSVASLALQLPRLSQMASQQQYAPMLESLKECLGADRLILWHYQTNGPLGSEQLTPVFTLGVDKLAAIRGDSRYIRALRTRGALSFSEAAHQPMLGQHYYLGEANVRSRLDGALLEQEKLIGALSLEYLEATLLGDEALQLVRHCAQLLGHWQPVQTEAKSHLLPQPIDLNVKTGHDYCRTLLHWAMSISGARIGWLGEFQLRGQDLWFSPRCIREGETFSSVKPMRMEIGPGQEIFRHGQSLYLDDLPQRYPQAEQLNALKASHYIGIPLPIGPGAPFGQLTLLLDEPLADPMPVLDALNSQRERAAVELQRLANDDALRLAEVAFNTHDGLLVMDHNGIILKVNDSFTRITGFESAEIIGLHITKLRPTYYGDNLKEEVTAAVNNAGYWLGEEQCLYKSGHLFPVRLMVTGVKDQDEISHFVCSFHDISSEKAAAHHIERLAYYDDLCDLYNRRSLNDIMQRTLQNPTGQWGALLLLDLDNFKSVNDSLGHASGDLLLQAVVVRLKSLPQENLVLARTSGDEFALLFTALGQGYVTAKILAEHFARELMGMFRTPFDVGDHKLHCSASVGISLFCDDDKDHLTLMQQADTAAHMAKRAGQGNYVFFSEAMAEKEKSKLALNNQLRDALRNNELVLHYQPQYRVDNGSLSGVEALVRWQKSDGTMVPPGDFIPVAEETTLIQEIGYWVMKTACAQYSFWLNNGLAIPHLSVNVSARQFHTTGFVQQVEYILRDTGVPPCRLLLEVTESVVLENRLESIARIRQLKALGILISIDDFGTGYSSLAYLRDLPADEVKLDRSFIQTLVHSEQDRAIVKAILDLARVFRFTVTAEGVEDEEQLSVLKTLGCQHYQGFLTSRPLPVKALETLLGSQTAG